MKEVQNNKPVCLHQSEQKKKASPLCFKAVVPNCWMAALWMASVWLNLKFSKFPVECCNFKISFNFNLGKLFLITLWISCSLSFFGKAEIVFPCP